MNSISKLSNLFLSLMAVLALGFSSCSPSETEDRPAFSDYDRDMDNLLDSEEFGAALEESGYYEHFDTNKDGYVDEHEWNNARQRYMGEYEGIFGDWDPDGNAQISREEFERGVYEHYDTDRDNMISENEYETWFGDLRD